MKKINKAFKKLIRHFLKDKWNIAITILVVLVLILGIAVVGVVKTLVVISIIIALVLALKYGGTLLMARKGKKKHSENKPKKKWKKALNFVFIGFLAVGIIGVILGFCFMGYIVVSAPKFDKQKLLYKEASIIYDNKGEEVMRIGDEMRDKVTYDELPQVFVDAIIATEDSRFFEHNGFDLPRFLKASFGQALGNSSAGGASTISMQVIKNNFTSIKQSITRKFTDIYLAIFKLEKEYTKEQILEFYVNDIHLCVNNTLGVAEASRGLFGKEIGDLNLSEASLLAGMFQAPCGYNPYNYPEKAEARRHTVLYLMERHGYITHEESEIADSVPIESLLIEKGSTQNPYQGFIDYVSKEVKEKTGYDPMEVPMKIYTTLDIAKQDYLNSILNGTNWTFENDLVQSGIAVTDTNTGAILALGNGRNRTDAKTFNLATDTKRQIGSTAKPIFDYAPGMEFNNWSTYTPFVDDVYTYSNGKEINNWDGKFFGMLTMRYALGQSRNVPALKAFQQIDNKKIIEFVQSLGIEPEIEGGRIHEAHAIGGFNGASPLQLAAAYAAFANGGYYIKPYSVSKIEIMDTNESTTYKSEKTRVMSDSTAYMITNILKYAVDNKLVGGGRVNGVEVAAKSGTSNFDQATKDRNHLAANAINDLWYAGISPDIAIGMWYGYEKISSEHYSKTPATSVIRDRLFSKIAQGIFVANGKKFEVPSSVIEVAIEKGTIPAMLPSSHTPSDMITKEYFKKGTEPTEVSARFNTLPNVTNLTADKEGHNVKLTWKAASAPNMITTEYLSTIAAQKDKYLAQRAAEDASILGTLGYNVYIKQSNGSLKFLGWTSSTSLTHTPSESGSLTYVVKTCYSIFKASESSGSQTTISDNPYVEVIEKYFNPNDSNWPNYINSMVTEETKTIALNSHCEEVSKANAILVLQNTIPVTEDVVITRSITKGSANTPVNLGDGLIILDTTAATTYKIKYTVTYNGESHILTRTIIVQ